MQTAPDATRSIANRLSFSPPVCYPAAASSPAGCDSPFLIIRERILCFHLLSLRFFFYSFFSLFSCVFCSCKFYVKWTAKWRFKVNICSHFFPTQISNPLFIRTNSTASAVSFAHIPSCKDSVAILDLKQKGRKKKKANKAPFLPP